MKRAVVLVALLLVLVLIAAACGDDDDNGDTQNAVDEGESAAMSLLRLEFAGPDVGALALAPIDTNQWAVQQVEEAYYITISEPEANLVITLENLPLDPDPDTYSISQTDIDDHIAATVTVGQGEDVEFYGEATEGALTLTETVDERWTGAFTFKAVGITSAGVAGDTEVTVRGEIRNMPLP